MTITVGPFPPLSPTSAQLLLQRDHKFSENKSDLHVAIARALRGKGAHRKDKLQTRYSSDTSSPSGFPTEQELAWNSGQVILSLGGVIHRKWGFQEEEQGVQWACLGFLQQSGDISSASAKAANMINHNDGSQNRSAFGPFSRENIDSKGSVGAEDRVTQAVFVFLRSIGKIFLLDGTEYTFALPFIVREAWPLYPHGVLIQRVVEDYEFEEARLTGEPALPSIFSFTTPFSEVATIGITNGITPEGTLTDEEDNCNRPLRSTAAEDSVLWVAPRTHTLLEKGENLMVTLNEEDSTITVWRYLYLRPKDTPSPLYDKPPPPPSVPIDHHDALPLRSLPNMAPSLSNNKITLASLASAEDPATSPLSHKSQKKARRNSLTRNDLSVTMDRMALGSRVPEPTNVKTPVENGRMKAFHWVEKLHTHRLSPQDVTHKRHIQFSLFDRRFDGQKDRVLLAMALPGTKLMYIFELSQSKLTPFATIPALSAVHLIITRPSISDLAFTKPDGTLHLLCHGTCEIPIVISQEERGVRCLISRLQDPVGSFATATLHDGSKCRVRLNFIPTDILTLDVCSLLSITLPRDAFYPLHRAFLDMWSAKHFRQSKDVQLHCLSQAIYKMLIPDYAVSSGWEPSRSSVHSASNRLRRDSALRGLGFTTSSKASQPRPPSTNPPHPYLTPVLHSLHLLAEDMRLNVEKHISIGRVAPIICRLAMIVRPEWADYWNRLCPGSAPTWPTVTSSNPEFFDDRLPSWPHDVWTLLYGRLNFPGWKPSTPSVLDIPRFFNIQPSYAFGLVTPLKRLETVVGFYAAFIDSGAPSDVPPSIAGSSMPSSMSINSAASGPFADDSNVNQSAERVIQAIVSTATEDDCTAAMIIDQLPLGISAPLREAARTCQLAPPGNWSAKAYRFIGRNDLAENVEQGKLMMDPGRASKEGWKTKKHIMAHMLRNDSSRKSVCHITGHSRALVNNDDLGPPTGVELDLQEFTDIRFGQDRRLEEVARMLCSSRVTLIRSPERSDLSDHDQAKEQQALVIRVAERTLSLPYGRAMFTFGSTASVNRESYVIPKLNFTVKSLPLNITTTTETVKLAQDSLSWGEFHNGVAAALRISPTAKEVEGTWISYNRPADLTPEHAGFLYGLGLTGHLSHLLPWNAFEYLSPKHQPTSIGILLGLAAANVGNAHRDVTKLLAVHTPALLPTPEVDLNVPLITQAAGLSGVGILYLGTRNRRMAEVSLGEISRRDLGQPDAANEHREAYTLSAGLAFGMIMLAQGSSIPADMELVARLTHLVHGDKSVLLGHKAKANFDINLTSPSATIALGLMYMRTERRDIAQLLTIPETALDLNKIQPSFLLVRTLARSLIMWNQITPTKQWVMAQVPLSLVKATEQKLKGDRTVDEAYELGYFNIVAACCFAVGLKYAGTARQEAYVMIVNYFDLFSHIVYTTSAQFQHKVKRAAVRDGLNLISISLCLIMAGTGEITCLRRLRHAYGLYLQQPRYGVHFSTNAAIGLLFLGGGRYTLGTSNAAIAALVTAFFPRTHHTSSDNKSYLQALRHLWVLAAEPRCLIARDVDTSEIVYLPVKISVKEAGQASLSQLISPTLIPDLDKLLSIRVDTPRYWPFLLDIAETTTHKDLLLRTQTLFVKRRTAFLSYTEDPRGSRSLFVRSVSSAGDAATLDFPQLNAIKVHPAGDLSEFITSFSNDISFLAFADHFSRPDEDAPVGEQVFQKYCYATLLDSILQDKPQTLRSHLLLYQYRSMPTDSPYFNLRLQDLRFAVDFYGHVYGHSFSGKRENNPRPSLLRHSTIASVLHSMDKKLEAITRTEEFREALRQYAHGQAIPPSVWGKLSPKVLSWYLIRNGVPSSSLLGVLKTLAMDAHGMCRAAPPPDGTTDIDALNQGIKEVVHATGGRLAAAWGSGWSRTSVEEIMSAWDLQIVT